MWRFERMLRHADVVVAHNIAFDHLIVMSEYIRLGMQEPDPFRGKTLFCTMMESMNVCKLPGRYGKYKWPALQEAYSKLVGGEFTGAHDALGDIRACKAVYDALQRLRDPREVVADALVEAFQLDPPKKE
jgi:DNA polymerase III epsilon subunit-like protein